jgi:hypothetical protein
MQIQAAPDCRKYRTLRHFQTVCTGFKIDDHRADMDNSRGDEAARGSVCPPLSLWAVAWRQGVVQGGKPSRALCDFPLDALLLPCRPDHQKLARPDAANDPASLDFGCIRVERARIVDRVIVGHLAVIDLVECDGAAASAADERRIERAARRPRAGLVCRTRKRPAAVDQRCNERGRLTVRVGVEPLPDSGQVVRIRSHASTALSKFLGA